MKAKKPPNVEVTWMDACFHSGTYKPEELDKAGLAERRTSGYLVRQDQAPGYTYIAQTLDHADDGSGWEYDGVFTIPTGWVLEVKHRRRKHERKAAPLNPE